MNLICSAENMARLPPFMDIFASARGSAKGIFAVIDRQSEIDSMNNEGKDLESSEIKGNIEFSEIYFNYPSRPDVEVLIKNG